MGTIFMNSKNSKTSDPHRLLLNLSDKINLKRSDRYVALSNLSIYYTWKNIKKSYKNSQFKISSNIEWRIWIIWWVIFCIRYSRLLWVLLEKPGKKTNNHSIKICVNKKENRIPFKYKNRILFWTFNAWNNEITSN